MYTRWKVKGSWSPYPCKIGQERDIFHVSCPLSSVSGHATRNEQPIFLIIWITLCWIKFVNDTKQTLLDVIFLVIAPIILCQILIFKCNSKNEFWPRPCYRAVLVDVTQITCNHDGLNLKNKSTMTRLLLFLLSFTLDVWKFWIVDNSF